MGAGDVVVILIGEGVAIVISVATGDEMKGEQETRKRRKTRGKTMVRI